MKALELLKLNGNSVEGLANEYAQNAAQEVFISVIQAAKEEIRKENMKIKSLENSISLSTDKNAGKQQMSYEEITSVLTEIVKAKAKVSILQKQFNEHVQPAYDVYFGEAKTGEKTEG